MATVSKLQIVLEATTTAFDRGLKSAQQSLHGFAKKTQDLHNRMDKFGRKHKETIQGLQAAGAAAAVGLGAMAVGIKGAVKAAIDFEKSMAGVKKVIDFETPEQFRQMEQDIIALSQSLPMRQKH
ncbi:phage tail tape measure protein [Moraxella bovoculi]|uniref:phage tail tape measure protein n=1 Tax=Moraxella bovoculi TaxID=386891 RepID=UPI003F4FA725